MIETSAVNRKICTLRSSYKRRDKISGKHYYAAFKYAVLFTCISNIFSTPAHSADCVSSGLTLRLAKDLYSDQCPIPRGDCDLINGIWHCSSAKNTTDIIDTTELVKQQEMPPQQVLLTEQELLTQQTGTLVTSPALSETRHVQQEAQTSDCVDSDGDGWGWNGIESCKSPGIAVSLTNLQLTRVTDVGLSATVKQTEQPDCVDSNGDGWGWNGVASCKVLQTVVSPARSQLTDTTDAYSINNVRSLRRESTERVIESAAPENCRKLDSGDYHITEMVTDVFLTAGQSNATGDQTRYQPDRYKNDRINDRVIVWTENNRWEIADPRTQIWHNGKYPGGYRVFNHPGFQIGRAIADLDKCRVVAFISTAAPGMPIDHWRHNLEGHYSDLTDKVTSAINALPVKHEVDMIWWMQGEADNDQIVSRYFYKLTDLISKFRSESWFPFDGYFVANETGWFPYANEAIRMLRDDDDNYSEYSLGEDSAIYPFPGRPREITRKIHFNEVSLRKIGDLVADKYVNEYLSNRNR